MENKITEIQQGEVALESTFAGSWRLLVGKDKIYLSEQNIKDLKTAINKITI